MHIEPGLVEGAKIALSYATATASLGYAAQLALELIKKEGAIALVLRSALASALVLCFFEVFPHHPIGVSEVHLILGTTLLLLFGVAPAALGLAGGLLTQGLFFAPHDMAQYGMNVTTLLVPLFASAAWAQRIIPACTAYVDISYAQALKLSLAYQGGIVMWVGFWAIYGRGVGVENMTDIATFGMAYLSVVLAEPVIDLAILALAKTVHGLQHSTIVQPRLHHAT